MNRLRLALLVISLIVGLCSLVTSSHADDSVPLQLTADAPHLSLSGYTAHYADNTTTLSWPQATQAPYTPLARDRNEGYSPAAHWYRFSLVRQAGAPREWVLAMGQANLDEVDVWIKHSDGQIQNRHMGDTLGYRQRPLQTRQFTIPLHLDQGEVTIFVRVASIGLLDFHAELWQPESFTSNETRTNLIYGIYFGILVIIAIFYFIIGTWLRDGVMLAYGSIVVTLFLMYLGAKGYVAVLLPSAPLWLPNAINGIGWIGGPIGYTIMLRKMLRLEIHYPRIALIFAVIGIACFCSLPFVTTPFYRTISQLRIIAGLFIGLSIPVLIWLTLRRERRIELVLYFIAFLLPVAGGITTLLTMRGWLPPHLLPFEPYQAATMSHVLVMSLALGFRLRQIQRDKTLAEKEVLLSAERAEEQRRFIGMLSHEFRDPLASIDRSAQMLQLQLPEISAPETKRLESIRNKSATLAGLVDTFLITEALDHKALALSFTPCSLKPLIKELVCELGEEAERRVTFSISPDNASFILDRNMMGRAISNLVSNALRYTPENSPITLLVRVNNDNSLTIQIEDRGPGLSEDELKNLGRPYYRAATSHGKKGCGLGFYFTQRVVEAHGGTLQTHSASGHGLRVTINMPAKTKDKD